MRKACSEYDIAAGKFSKGMGKAEVERLAMKRNEIKVSVIVLTFNHEKYIAQALDSILMQKVDFNYEILVGDDASSDQSPAIIRHYQELYPERVHAFFAKVNQGTTRNAYRLFTHAKGKYLASCESDDYWTDPYKLQKQVDFLENHPDYIGCSHKVQSVDENGYALKQQKIWWISDRRVFKLKHFKGIRLPGHSASIVRRNIFRDPKYDYSIFYQAHPFIGDRTSTMLFLAQGNFYRLPGIMSCFRRRRDGTDTSLTQRLYQENENRILEELEFEHRLEYLYADICNSMKWRLALNIIGVNYLHLLYGAGYCGMMHTDGRYFSIRTEH